MGGWGNGLWAIQARGGSNGNKMPFYNGRTVECGVYSGRVVGGNMLGSGARVTVANVSVTAGRSPR